MAIFKMNIKDSCDNKCGDENETLSSFSCFISQISTTCEKDEKTFSLSDFKNAFDEGVTEFFSSSEIWGNEKSVTDAVKELLDKIDCGKKYKKVCFVVFDGLENIKQNDFEEAVQIVKTALSSEKYYFRTGDFTIGRYIYLLVNY